MKIISVSEDITIISLNISAFHVSNPKPYSFIYNDQTNTFWFALSITLNLLFSNALVIFGQYINNREY